ncbi:hypothetical protein QTP88_025467 [Uroleucon formosanum]
MNEASIPFTSFVTPLGQFEYLKMPFGLTNAFKVFSRFTQQIFADLIKREEIILYMDDILIAAKAVPENFVILKKVFNLAAKFNLKFRLDKCSFLYEYIEYLGYIIDEVGVRPSPRNIDSVKNYPIPKNQKQVRQFIGLASYFRRSIPNFSLIVKPLHNLLKKDIPFVFGNAEQCVFNTLKNQLSEAPILSIYSPSAKTELHCDASSYGYGYGSVLLQRQVTGKLHPIFYFSQRTTQAESRYHSFELECLAVVYSIKRFHIYLAGIHFKIITDCNSFRSTLDKQNINPRISRWVLFLQNYDFEISHRPGTKMGHVDALSRCHNILVLEANTFEQILSVKQRIDGKIVEIRNNLEVRSDKYFELREGLVYLTRTPRANGQVEVVNQSIVPMLAKISEPINEWDKMLYKVEFAINNTIHRSTGQTPSRLLFGINQVGDVSDELRHMIEEINEKRFDLPEIREKASDQIVKAQTESEKQYDVGQKEPVKYNL